MASYVIPMAPHVIPVMWALMQTLWPRIMSSLPVHMTQAWTVLPAAVQASRMSAAWGTAVRLLSPYIGSISGPPAGRVVLLPSMAMT